MLYLVTLPDIDCSSLARAIARLLAIVATRVASEPAPTPRCKLVEDTLMCVKHAFMSML